MVRAVVGGARWLKKAGVVCCAAVFLLVFFVSAADALGISGDVKVIRTFEPGFEETFKFRVVASSGDETSDYSISPGCELGRYVMISRAKLFGLDGGDISEPIEVTLRLPRDLNLSCGIHEACVAITDDPGESLVVSEGPMITTKIFVSQVMVIKALCDGKVFSYNFDFPQVRLDQTSRVKLELHSGGKENISAVVSNVNIYDSNGSFVSSFSFPTVALEPGEEKIVWAEWTPADYDISLRDEYEFYKAIITVAYDGISAEGKESVFKVESDKIIVFKEAPVVDSGKAQLVNTLLLVIALLVAVMICGFVYLGGKKGFWRKK